LLSSRNAWLLRQPNPCRRIVAAPLAKAARGGMPSSSRDRSISRASLGNHHQGLGCSSAPSEPRSPSPQIGARLLQPPLLRLQARRFQRSSPSSMVAMCRLCASRKGAATGKDQPIEGIG
jgi:hypothetical protein